MGVVKSMAKQLRWQCIPKVYTLGIACQVAPGEPVKPVKKAEIERKAKKVAKAVRNRVGGSHIGLREKAEFFIFRKMQSSSDAVWNPTDRDWWVNQGWTGDIRPWKRI